MKNLFYLFAVGTLVLAGCDKGGSNDGPEPKPQPVKVTGVTVDPKTYTLDFGAKFTLKATVTPANADDKTVTWASDKPAVVAVDAATGEVTGLTEGNATVTAKTKDGGFTASAVVTVNPKPVTYPITEKAGTLDWSLAQNGTLTVSGEGAIPDYGVPTGGTRAEMVVAQAGAAPWAGWAGEIKVVVIVQGVTAIGTGAFAGLGALTSVTLPDSVESIGAGAFAGCGVLVAINIADGTDVGEGAFTGCVALPDGVIPPPLDVLDIIPDAAFKAYVELKMVEWNWDENGDGRLSKEEAARVGDIRVGGTAEAPGNVKSLAGIEYFTGLYILDCQYNPGLTAIDLSKNGDLVTILCEGCNLTSLDVTALPLLYILDCGENLFTTIDLSKNPKLDYIRCFEGALTSIDVSNNLALRYMIISRNSLTTLDVSKNTKLVELQCGYNPLTSLDVSKNKELKSLYVANCSLTSLDVSNNTELGRLQVHYNRLTGIDVSNNTKLTYFNCSYNPGSGGVFRVKVWAGVDTNNLPSVFLNDNGHPIQGWGTADGKETKLLYGNYAGFDSGGVTIGGVTWATSNVQRMGEFADNPWDFGGFFKWDDDPHAAITNLVKTACPEGWRPPTMAEFRSLGQGTLTTVKADKSFAIDPGDGLPLVYTDQVNGYRFGSGDNTIFLPCAGYRLRHDAGFPHDVNRAGYYYCYTFDLGSNPISELSYSVFGFGNPSGDTGSTNPNEHNTPDGLHWRSVRCVKE